MNDNDDFLDTPLKELNLSPRILQVAKKLGIKTPGGFLDIFKLLLDEYVEYLKAEIEKAERGVRVAPARRRRS